jgi:hypothetical protein
MERNCTGGKILSGFVFFLFILAFVLYNKNQKQKDEADRKKNKRYTVGFTIRKYKNFRSSEPQVKYVYKVYGKQYVNFEPLSSGIESKVLVSGGNYYVEYSSEDPENSKILFDRPITDSNSIPPING